MSLIGYRFFFLISRVREFNLLTFQQPMHIKEIIIDGFKSYHSRQVVSDLDLSFNAITGLNGSGKSNILDSICFLLGIQKLDAIRAGHMHDLIYKQGQAGITKATVTVVFDNTGPRTLCFPDKYNADDVVTIKRVVAITSAAASGCQSTYYVNGKVCPTHTVADAFKSVGLNVNNPHFLIMQGRITKVLNMKPPEVLCMIEEAAGTRLYEGKKAHALKIIHSKDHKLLEIDKMIDDEIKPMLNIMRANREKYLRKKKLERDEDILHRKFNAFSYHTAVEQVDRWVEKIATHEKSIEDAKQQLKEETDSLKEMQEEQMKRDEVRNKEAAESKKTFDKDVDTAHAELNEAQKKRDDIKSELKECQGVIKAATDSLKKDEHDLIKQNDDLEKKRAAQGKDAQEGETTENEIKDAKAQLEALQQGMTVDAQGNAVTHESLLASSKTNLSTLMSKLNLARQNLDAAMKKKSTNEAELKKHAAESKAEKEALAGKTKELKKLEDEIAKLNHDHEAFEKMMDELSQMEGDLNRSFAEFNQLEAKKRRHEPTVIGNSNLNQNEVCGSIMNMFRFKNKEDAEVLQMICGSSVGQLVVQTQKTATDLFKFKCLPRRTTVYPLTEYAYSPDTERLMKQKLQLARQLVTNGTVECAFDLITCQDSVRGLMQNKFGQVLICENANDAAKVCYDPSIRVRTMTRDGSNDYSPHGLLTGGSRQRQMISEITLFNEFFEKNDIRQTILDAVVRVKAKIDEERPKHDKYNRMAARQEELKNEIDAQMERAGFSTIGHIEAELKSAEEAIPKYDEEVKEYSRQAEREQNNIKQLEKNRSESKEDQMKSLAAKLKKLETLRAGKNKQWADARSQLDVINKQIEYLADAVAKAKRTIETETAKLDEIKARIEAEQGECDRLQVILASKESAKKKHTDELRANEKASHELTAKIEKLRKELAKKETEIEQQIKASSEFQSNLQSYKGKIKDLKKKYSWIEQEKENFGQKGSNFDFTGYTESAATKELEAVRKELGDLDHINCQGDDILGPAEERTMELQRRRKQLEVDREKLMETISVIDEKKKEEVLRAYKNVSKDFDNIFGTLLPGACAKLRGIMDNDGDLKGCEIQVGFSKKWKDSLSELSGGQRSLVALSLVLAMLKYKPAPIYILDEVDAALDLSHTANIGLMIKQHFTQSQFIIVSLKEGMFNHASVLYRTKFVDGTSTITRTDNKKKSKA